MSQHRAANSSGNDSIQGNFCSGIQVYGFVIKLNTQYNSLNGIKASSLTPRFQSSDLSGDPRLARRRPERVTVALATGTEGHYCSNNDPNVHDHTRQGSHPL